MNILKVGLLGFGALGQTAAEIIENMEAPVEVSGVLKRKDTDKQTNFPIMNSIEDFLSLEHDVVIECAGHEALKQFGVTILERGIDLVPASMGVLADDLFRKDLLKASSDSNSMIRVPGGGILGIDGLAAARHWGLNNVLYKGTFHPRVLLNDDNNIDSSKVIFEGNARQAVFKFPNHANITATISLNGIGFDRTQVKYVIDPTVKENINELYVSGEFGEFNVRIAGKRINQSSPSSRLVPASLVQAAMKSNYSLLV